jgi:predicted nucleotidyltransferase
MSIPERWERVRQLPPDIKQKLDQLIPLFEQKDVQLAYLFGSLSQDKQAQDVDLAILTRNEPAFHLREAITDCLNTERVDLVDLQSASPVLRFEILRTGQLLYAANEMLSEKFELDTLRLYKDTAWLRRHQETFLKERMKQWSSDRKPSASA